MSIYRFYTKPRIQMVAAFFLIGVAVTIPYAQVAGFEFVSFDDSLYVYENPHVLKGLNQESIKWAFGFSDRAYWHPLTWLSLMADYTIFGLNPRAFHSHNVFLHLLNAWLLFLLLLRTAGGIEKCFVVALLFAIHPLNVESVAWVAERKNLLAGFFWLLTLLSYSSYCQRPSIGRYGRTLMLFVLGLMAKPVLVALPLVFLLWDEWPFYRSAPYPITSRIEKSGLKIMLNGFGLLRWGALVIEKLPFLVFATLTVTLATLSAEFHGIIVPTSETSFFLRLANAIVSYTKYIAKMVFPHSLSVFYAYPDSISAVSVASALVMLGVMTGFVWKRRKTMGYCFTGWLWFIVALVPTSGIKQAGLWPAMADRWAYLPLIGLFIALTWGMAHFLEKRQIHKWIPPAIIMLACVLIILTWRQTKVWSNSQTLYSHAVSVDAHNHIAHSNLGGELYRSGHIEEAIQHFVQALITNPDYADAQNNLLTALEHQIGLKNMLSLMNRLSLSYPDNPVFPYLMGTIALQSGDSKSAIKYYRRALDKDPGFIQALNDLGRSHVLSGECASALEILKRRAGIAPVNSGLFYDMARCYARTGENENAVLNLEKAIDLGFDNWPLLQQDPWLRHVREDPQLKELIDRHSP